MDNAGSQEVQARRLVYFAAERTLLAWIRVSLSLMVLGFVVDRFGFYLRQMEGEKPSPDHLSSVSFWAGIAFVAIAVLMNVYAAARFARFQRGYRERDCTEPGYGMPAGTLFAIIVALTGVGVAIVLVTASAS
jgi:uncharacterized membrane protein YidH (DUF202 family)